MIQVMLTLMDLKALLNLTQPLQFIFGKLRMVIILVISNCMTSTSFNSSRSFNRSDAEISNKRRCFNVSTQQNVTVSIIVKQ